MHQIPNSDVWYGCGQLRTAGGGYTVTPRGKEYVIQVLSKPRPFLVAMGADGNMVGMVLIEIKFKNAHNQFLQAVLTGQPLAIVLPVTK